MFTTALSMYVNSQTHIFIQLNIMNLIMSLNQGTLKLAFVYQDMKKTVPLTTITLDRPKYIIQELHKI